MLMILFSIEHLGTLEYITMAVTDLKVRKSNSCVSLTQFDIYFFKKAVIHILEHELTKMETCSSLNLYFLNYQSRHFIFKTIQPYPEVRSRNT